MTSWKISWNVHDQKTLSHSDWQLNCQICLFYVYCTSKLDLYILDDAPVSKRLIIDQGGSQSETPRDFGKMRLPQTLVKWEMRLPISLRLWNTWLVSSRASLTSWGEGASSALVSHPSSDGVTIKMHYGVEIFYIDQLRTPIFSYWVG